ncbi:MAG: hypothetical protein ABIH42_02395 [Planctomycetota bacterium]
MKKQKETIEKENEMVDLFSHLPVRYRQRNREDVCINCNLKIILQNGRTFDKGRAAIKNLSSSGALLDDFKTKKQVLPMKPFSIKLDMLDKEFDGISVDCEPVRIQTENGFAIGVIFKHVTAKV